MLVEQLPKGKKASNINDKTRAITNGNETAKWTDCLQFCLDNAACNYFDHKPEDVEKNTGSCWIHEINTDEVGNFDEAQV